MEELCGMMKNQKLICPDENNMKLKAGLQKCQHIFRNASANSESYIVRNHLLESKSRYIEYLRKIPFTNTFNYLVKSMEEFCINVHENTPSSMNQYLLYVSYFIDAELLMLIGELEIQYETSDNVIIA